MLFVRVNGLPIIVLSTDGRGAVWSVTERHRRGDKVGRHGGVPPTHQISNLTCFSGMVLVKKEAPMVDSCEKGSHTKTN
jgi:hypothetical protein